MNLPVLVLLAAMILMTRGLVSAEPATQPDGAVKVVDADKAATAQVVVRGVLEADPAGPPKGGWPTYILVISQVFKTPEDVKITVGQKLTVKTVKDITGPVTLYLVFDKDQKLYRLQDPLGDRGFSHVGAAATTTQPVANKTVAFDVHGGYFVSNKFEPTEPASFVVISDQKAFDSTFGVAFVMGDKSHRLPANAFDSKMVVAVIKRGKAMWQFTVQDVQASQAVLTVRYTATAKPQESAEFACPLIVSIAKGGYSVVEFIENGKRVQRVELPGTATQLAAKTCPVDANRLAKAPVVLRVKWKSISPPGGNPSDTVEVLAVLKNEPGKEWGQEARIDHEPGKNGVPHDQECTVYLEVNQKLKGRPWALLGGGADVGVSHVGPQAPASTTRPSASTDTFDIKCRKPEDRVNVAVADGNAVFTVTSPRGISGATIERRGEKWPKAVILRLHLRGLESLAISCGEMTLAASVLSHSGNPRLLHLGTKGEEGPRLTKDSPYWMEVRVLDASGKPITGLPDKGGYFELAVPQAMLEKAKAMKIEWVDFYRG